MKRRSFSVLPLFAAGVCLSVLLLVTPTNRYVIEFAEGDIKAANTFVHTVQSQYKDAKIHIAETFNHELFSGVSFGLNGLNGTEHDLALHTILNHHHIKSMYPVRAIPRPETSTQVVKASSVIDPSILPHAMTQVDRVHSELKNTGKGISVGILDTGVDYLHPALGGGFGEGFKVRYGYDLVGNDYDGASPNPIVKPDSDPFDSCTAASGASGHGTHVSGTVAGNDPTTKFIGVAPDATLGMWRVFGCKGSTGNDVIIKGLLMAYDAGVDVISLSLGDTSSWTEGPDAIVAQRIAERGVPVIIAAGNDGANGIYTVGQPSTGKDVWSIASMDNDFHFTHQFQIAGANTSYEFLPAAKIDFASGAVAAGDINVGSGKDGCDPSTTPTGLTGKIAILQRGTCTFDIKAQNVAKAGAVGLLVYNNNGGDIFAPSSPGATIPVGGVSAQTGAAILAGIKAAKADVVLNFTAGQVVSPLSTGKTVSSFSSVGATYELDLKPNLAGVGGEIYSTLPSFLGSWGVMSGTSMATPYVSGSVALYIKSRGKKNPAKFIEEQFQNYAYKAVNAKGKAPIESPLRQGAGLVQVYDAIQQNVHVSPAQISFNDTSSSLYKTHSLTIRNYGKTTVTYNLFNNASIAIAPYDLKNTGYAPLGPTGFTSADAKLIFSKKTIRLAPGKSDTVKVTVVPPKTNPDEHIMYGGYVQFKSQQLKNALDITVPYFGIVGEQHKLPLFDVNTPYLSDPTGTPVFSSNTTYEFDRSNSTTAPTIVYRLLTASRWFNVAVIDAKTKKMLGTTMNDAVFLPRNTMDPTNQFSTLTWDGTYLPVNFQEVGITTPVVSGDYILRLRALTLLGNPSNPQDWYNFQTGVIAVKN
ncbi:peptidase S8/S53 domain-containing protein [Spinellus fusiger]|nr:peptidase S8/S53 domain-containing protein [Spinellus fusiger]